MAHSSCDDTCKTHVHVNLRRAMSRVSSSPVDPLWRSGKSSCIVHNSRLHNHGTLRDAAELLMQCRSPARLATLCCHGHSSLVQNYPWGKKGNESLAARLCSHTPNTGFKIDNSKEYAEMWMGDYPELPAKVLKTGEDLHKVIEDNKEQLLGPSCIKKFGAVLPYLPKVYLGTGFKLMFAADQL